MRNFPDPKVSKKIIEEGLDVIKSDYPDALPALRELSNAFDDKMSLREVAQNLYVKLEEVDKNTNKNKDLITQNKKDIDETLENIRKKSEYKENVKDVFKEIGVEVNKLKNPDLSKHTEKQIEKELEKDKARRSIKDKLKSIKSNPQSLTAQDELASAMREALSNGLQSEFISEITEAATLISNGNIGSLNILTPSERDLLEEERKLKENSRILNRILDEHELGNEGHKALKEMANNSNVHRELDNEDKELDKKNKYVCKRHAKGKISDEDKKRHDDEHKENKEKVRIKKVLIEARLDAEETHKDKEGEHKENAIRNDIDDVFRNERFKSDNRMISNKSERKSYHFKTEQDLIDQKNSDGTISKNERKNIEYRSEPLRVNKKDEEDLSLQKKQSRNKRLVFSYPEIEDSSSKVQKTDSQSNPDFEESNLTEKSIKKTKKDKDNPNGEISLTKVDPKVLAAAKSQGGVMKSLGVEDVTGSDKTQTNTSGKQHDSHNISRN